MVDHEVRLERMLKDDEKRRKELLFPLMSIIVLLFFYLWTLNIFLLYTMILVGQFPNLYKSWHRKKLLLSFNEDARYQQQVQSEFYVGLAIPSFLLILIICVLLDWVTLLSFVIAMFVGLLVLTVIGVRFDRKLKEIDPLHVTGVEFSHVQLQRKKRKSEA